MNSIFFDYSKNLLISTNSNGYSIYNLTNFNKIHENKTFSYSLKICKILFNSNIILFVPSNKENEIIIYDDKNNKEIASINFKENFILNFEIIKNFIFIQLKNCIKIFDLITLNLINDINDVDNKNSFILFDKNFIVCMNILNSNKNIIKINKLNEKNNNFIFDVIKTNLNNIKNISIDNKNFDFFIVFDDNLNFNLFKIENFDLIFEFKIKSNFNIFNIFLFKNEFLLILFSNNHIQIFNLINNNNNNNNENYLNIFCEYKFEKNFFDIEKKNKILINYYKKSEFLIINSLTKTLKKIKFNTKEKNKIWEILKLNYI